jgi:hypothetical protein
MFISRCLYKAQHVSGDTLPIIRTLKLKWQPLVFYTWKGFGREVGRLCQAQCAWQRPPTARPTTLHLWKTRICQCSFRLLMMGGVSPETCWALYKHGIFKSLLNFCIFFWDFSLLIMNNWVKQGNLNQNLLPPYQNIKNENLWFQMINALK